MSSDKHCCIPGCKDSGGMHAVLHGFPNPEKDRLRFNTWLYSVGSDILCLENEFIHKYRRICHRHFEDKYLCRGNRLSNIAVPTLYLPGLFITNVNTGGTIAGVARKKIANVVTNDKDADSQPQILATHTIGDHYDHNYYSKNEDMEEISESSVVVQEHPVDHVYSRTADINVDPLASTIYNTDLKNENPPNLSACEQSAPPSVLVGDESPRAALCDAMLSSADDDVPEPSPPPPPLLDLHTAQICRVCLALDVKMFHLRDTELKIMFHSITGIEFEDNEGSTLGSLICWECAARLRAASTFRSKALLSDTLLQRLINKGEQIENNYFETVKEEADRLIPPKTLTATEIIRIVEIEGQNHISQLSQSGDDDQHSISDHSETQDSVIDDNLQMYVEEDDNVAIATEIEDHPRPTCSHTEDENKIKIIYNEIPEFIGISAIEETADFGSSILLDTNYTELPRELTSSQEDCDDQIIETFIESITKSRKLFDKNRELQTTNKRTRVVVDNDCPYNLKEDTEDGNKKKKLKTNGGTSRKVSIRKAARNTQV